MHLFCRGFSTLDRGLGSSVWGRPWVIHSYVGCTFLIDLDRSVRGLCCSTGEVQSVSIALVQTFQSASCPGTNHQYDELSISIGGTDLRMSFATEIPSHTLINVKRRSPGPHQGEYSKAIFATAATSSDPTLPPHTLSTNVPIFSLVPKLSVHTIINPSCSPQASCLVLPATP